MLFGLIDLIIELPFFILEFYLSKEERSKRKIKRTKSKKLSEIRTGHYVKIHGKVLVHEKIMKSPLNQERCVGYKVLVSRQQSSSKEEGYINDEFVQNFYLSDGDRKILVMPRKANLDLKMNKIASTGLFKDADSKITEFLKKHQTKSTSFGFNKSLDFEEGVIKEGAKITVVGKVSFFRSRNKPKQIVIRHLEDSPLYIQTEK